jgi:hypothetical protein
MDKKTRYKLNTKRPSVTTLSHLNRREMAAVLTLTPTSGDEVLDRVICQGLRRQLACHALAGLLASRPPGMNTRRDIPVDTALDFVEVLISGLEARL